MKLISIDEINKLADSKLSLRDYEELIYNDQRYSLFITQIDDSSKLKYEKELIEYLELRLPIFVDFSKVTIIYEKQNRFTSGRDEYYICAYYDYNLNSIIKKIKLQAFL